MQRKTTLPPHRVLPARTTLAEAVLEHLRDLLVLDRETTEVLDYGCGSGALDFLLSPYVRRITAVDPSAALIADLQSRLAQSPLRNIKAAALDWRAAPLRLGAARFDLVISAMTCHHIAELQKFLPTVKSLLKSEGVLCIIDLQKEDGSFHAPDVTVPHAGFIPGEFSDLLAEWGFFHPETVVPYVIRRKTSAPGQEEVWRDYPLFMVLADNAPAGCADTAAVPFIH